MEKVVSTQDNDKLVDNFISTENNNNIFFKNTTITFHGKNNILFIDKDARFENTKINFHGDNSIIFIGKTRKNIIKLNVSIYNNSVLYFGKNCSFNGILNIIVSESKRIIIGEDCMFSFGCWIRNSDVHLIFNTNGERINHSKNIIIGNHVWIGQNVSILKGVSIGSGSILALGSIITKNVETNSIYAGNPSKLVNKNIFWDRESTHKFTEKEIQLSKIYNGNKSDFIFLNAENLIQWKEAVNNKIDLTQLNSVNTYINNLGNLAPLSISSKDKLSFVNKLKQFLVKKN